MHTHTHTHTHTLSLSLFPSPSPPQVWVLDCLPGEVRAGEGPTDAGDHPSRLIGWLRSMRMPVAHRSAVIDTLVQAGFSPGVAQWSATNLRLPAAPASSSSSSAASPSVGGSNRLWSWAFDLEGIQQMYQ